MKYLLTLLMASFFTLSANAQTISGGFQYNLYETKLIGKMEAVNSFHFSVSNSSELVKGFSWNPQATLLFVSHNNISEEGPRFRKRLVSKDSRMGNAGILLFPASFRIDTDPIYSGFAVGVASFVEPLGGDLGNRFGTALQLDAGLSEAFKGIDIGLKYIHVFNGNNAEISLLNLDTTMITVGFNL